MEEKSVVCMVCEWTSKKEEYGKAKWNDLSKFDDDSMCSNKKGSGWWECPVCGYPCQEMK